MENESELQQYLKAIRRKADSGAGRHPGHDELIAYHQGDLDEGQQQQVQTHLVQCPECLSVFREVIAFYNARSVEAPRLSQAQRDRIWAASWPRAQFQESSTASAPSPSRVGFWQNPRAMFVLAASVLIAAALLGFWALSLYQENRELAARWQPQEQRWAEQLKAVEQENRRLQKQAEHYESQLSELRQPALNAPIYDLFPQEAISRGGGANNINRIPLPPAARTVVLILNQSSVQQYPDYHLDIIDEKGQARWRGIGLKPHRNRTFVLTLDRAFLSRGRYTLNLYGRMGEQSTLIARYIVVLE
jgi:hypothetical protein